MLVCKSMSMQKFKHGFEVLQMKYEAQYANICRILPTFLSWGNKYNAVSVSLVLPLAGVVY